jgi:thioredoxin reductase (NADPH)
LQRLKALCQAQAINFTIGQVTGIASSGGRLTHLKVTSGDATTQALSLDVLLVCQGLSPRLGALAEWGVVLEKKQVAVNTATFETQVPGMFAVGDINTYPGKRKLILCGFHEATLAAFGVAAQLYPGEPIHLQYTTTSPRLHKLLGVDTPASI